MSNEYLPLARLIERGLQEGTVLEDDTEHQHGKTWWDGFCVMSLLANGEAVMHPMPFASSWRIVSVEEKR